MDDLVWAEEALTAIIQRCQTQLEINTELWVNVSGEITPNPTIIDNLCPNECSGQGTCKDSESISTQIYWDQIFFIAQFKKKNLN